MSLHSPPPLDPSLFDFPDDLLWVMHCAEGPMPRPSREAVEALAGLESRVWELDFRRHVVELPARVRRLAAELVGAREEDISLTATTTTGLALVARGYPWQAGDEVVVPQGEFPTNVWPWKALAPRGVTTREVPLWTGQRSGNEAWSTRPPTAETDLEARLLDALGPATRILAVSWVRFQDGLRLDLARLAAGCRERGVELVVDGIQGAGTLPVELQAMVEGEPLDDLASPAGLAAFASGGHKGLLAAHGQGFLWTREDFRRSLAPPGGWLSVEEADRFARPSTDFLREFLPDGRKLETGVPNLLGCAALASSLELLLAAGPGAIAHHVAARERQILDALAERPAWRGEAKRLAELLDAGRLGSILAFHHGQRGPGGLDGLLDEGRRRNIHASMREGYLRLALHGWHGVEDGERLVGWVGGMV